MALPQYFQQNPTVIKLQMPRTTLCFLVPFSDYLKKTFFLIKLNKNSAENEQYVLILKEKKFNATFLALSNQETDLRTANS